MQPLFDSPPASVCILRLSAIGDVCHTLAVVRTLQQAWPDTRFTWIIGKLEAKLLGHLPDIELVIVDKRDLRGAYRLLQSAFRGRRFDLLLHMQLALRASVLSRAIPARVRLGFDRARARELQWLFTNAQIAPAERQHVLDALFGFAERLGVYDKVLRWDIPLPQRSRDHAARLIPRHVSAVVISPCSSHPLRNWRAEYYAEVADYAATSLGLQVVLCGGPSEIEQRMGREIEARLRKPCINAIGKDTLLDLLATLARAKVLIAPDSGPAHMATAVGTPVVGLYAATNPARTGPYLSRQWCVDKYEVAAQRLLGKPAGELPWTTKIERPGVMDLITPEDVTRKLHGVMVALAKRR